MATPAHKPTAEDRQRVETMAGVGISEKDIALVLDVSEPTLRKHYRRELDVGHIKANSAVAASLYAKATGNGPQAVAAAIFWCKTRMGWRDPNSVMEIISKKEEASWAAKRAGLGTEWGDDLQPPPPPKDLN